MTTNYIQMANSCGFFFFYRFSCGFKDSSIFEDVFKPVVDKKKLKRLSFYNVLHGKSNM